MRVPSRLLGIFDKETALQDANCNQLDIAVKKRLDGIEADDDGYLWELCEVIKLPFDKTGMNHR